MAGSASIVSVPSFRLFDAREVQRLGENMLERKRIIVSDVGADDIYIVSTDYWATNFGTEPGYDIDVA